MRVLRYFVDMYDYHGRASHYDTVYRLRPWLVNVDIKRIESGFEGKVYTLGVF